MPPAARTRSRSAARRPAFLGGSLPGRGKRAAGAAGARVAGPGHRGGVRLHENTPVRRLGRTATAVTEPARRAARSRARCEHRRRPGSTGIGLALAVASSHMVITEPVPDVIEELGWTGGENVSDCRTLLHYFRTTQRRTHRARLGRRTDGGRWPPQGAPRCRPRRRSARDRRAATVLPATERAAADARLGRADRRLPYAPADLRHPRAVHHGFGFTGNGVGPSYLGGEILARLALDRRDELTPLAIVEPSRKLFPPEPFRFSAARSFVERSSGATPPSTRAARPIR